MYATSARSDSIPRNGARGRSRSVFLSAVPILAVIAFGPAQLLSAQSALPSIAPLNPGFQVQVSTAHAKIKLGSSAPSGHALGGLTPPTDMSHMTGQHPVLTSGAHVQAVGSGYAASYDLRALGKVSSVKDQGGCGACWTFAAMASLESRLLTAESRDFSENNLKDTSGFDYAPCYGGEFIMSTAYLSRWSGPWNETDDPYNETASTQSPVYPSANAQKHVQEVLFLPDRGGSLDNDNIKSALTNYGAVQTSIYMDTNYYNSSSHTYYYYETAEAVNHAVTIVGWDDNYPAANFKITPPGNGAFIVKNSWGSSWGENGYFYVSYYDTKLIYNTAYIVAASTSNYYRTYQYDPLGQTSAMGYGTNTAWFSNVFTAAEDYTQVSAVSFYTLALNSTYDIYVYRDMPTPGDPRSGTLAASQSGSQAYAGYHTVPLSTPVPLIGGQKFTVVVRITTPGYDYPVPMETPVNGYSGGALASAGQSYVSQAGSVWSDMTGVYANTNVNLKAFTSFVPDSTPPSDVAAVNDGTGADIDYTASRTKLSANWTASSDPESGIRRYWYAIGTSAGGSDVVGWTDNGSALSATKTGLGLAGGTTYYFSVKAENWVGLQSSTTTSDGLSVDISSPAAPGAVYDGTGADITYTPSGSRLSANWAASSEPESAISRYWYAISSTTAGGTEFVGWTDNGPALSTTVAGLVLSNGVTYYFSVKGENAVGMVSPAAFSNGQMVDASSPAAPGYVYDGPGADAAYTNISNQLYANWGPTSDAQSGVVRYLYAVGTTPGDTDVVGWTDNGLGLSAVASGLSLTSGVTYYFTVKAQNGSGLFSPQANSNGQMVDKSPPLTVPQVRDGQGPDIAYSTSVWKLSANWDATTDAQSGVARYWYAIGTTPGGLQFLDWTDNGLALSTTVAGLNLPEGGTYYFSVKAENGSGLLSNAANSDGQVVDISSSSAITQVRDGLGADAAYSAFVSSLSANWDPSSDTQSGVLRYWYAIGTTPGGTGTRGWTDNGAVSSVTATGLALTSGVTYYFSVKAENGAGFITDPVNSDGFMVDTSAPSTVGAVRDSTGTDKAYSVSPGSLSANWNAAADAQSGIARYWYAISSKTAGGTEFAGWTDNGLSTTVARGGLALQDGVTYYFTVKAQNGAGLFSTVVNSDGQMVDSSSPTAVTALNDGTGADIVYTSSSFSLAANWAASSDPNTAVISYWYAIGTTPGGTETRGWTNNNGTALSTTAVGLPLSGGVTYYFSVRAQNAAGLLSDAATSDGQTVDLSSSSAITQVRDGLGADAAYSALTSTLSANWEVSSDTESGLARYWYAIGTTPGGTGTRGWTDNGLSVSTTATGLSLANGVTYYFSVKAENGAGLIAGPVFSDGIMVDITAPTTVGAVRDSTGTDQAYSISGDRLGANWNAATDAQSGIARYWYAISSTTAGGTEFADWADNGLSTSVIRSGLALEDGVTYYFTVKAENGSGLLSAALNSDGQLVDLSSPTASGAVNDGAGADIDYTNSGSALAANWPAFHDLNAPIAKYWYAVGTAPGGTDLLGWTDNGASRSVSLSGLSLANGAVYYFSVAAQNAAGLLSLPEVSDGVMSDITAPSAPAAVYDGLAAVSAYSGSLTQLSAHWPAASDAQSGIAKYWYAISSTTAGATEFVGWTDNGLSTSATKTGLTLADGVTYYFTVKAENGAGILSAAAVNSNGQMVDATAPLTIAQVRDSTGTDKAYSVSSNTLSANWDPSSDAQSGLLRYWYAIGVTPGGAERLNWTNNGLSTSVIRSGLPLNDGVTYYFSVKAENGAGLFSVPANSDGQMVDTSSPSVVSPVRDGTGADTGYTIYADRLSANWAASSDAQSGVTRYLYAIGSTPGGLDVSPWTDNALNTSVTRTGLALSEAATYYFSVMAENAAGLYSAAAVSDGQLVDLSSPSAVAQVNDGTGADAAYVITPGQLSANWTAALDYPSGVGNYLYGIGTAPGATDVTGGLVANGPSLSVTWLGTLTDGVTYYVSVVTEDRAGLRSSTTTSSGQLADLGKPVIGSLTSATHPSQAAWYDSSLPAYAWSASDALTGVQGYYYLLDQTASRTPAEVAASSYTVSPAYAETSPKADGVWYFHLAARDKAGNLSAVSNYTTRIDASSPAAVTALYDGTGADAAYSVSGSNLSANWAAASDAQSGIARYWYAISSTTAGGTEFVGWTDNGANTSAARSGLSLADGVTYYFTVKAENGAGLQSAAANSDGQMVDTSSPAVVAQVRDGAGADIQYTASASQLSANWAASADTQSGVARYWYAVGTTPGGADFIGWTENGAALSVTRNDLGITDGATYYFTVKAENKAGLQSAAAVSNGQVADLTAPSAPAFVYDGTGADIAYSSVTGTLSANWGAAADSQSGIVRYWYTIGTEPGGVEISTLTDNGLNASVTRTGLLLDSGSTYYFTVQAENGAAALSAPASSNGQLVDTVLAANIAYVRDGAGAEDINYVSSHDTLSANWAASSHPRGINHYEYAIGSAPGGTTVADWTSSGLSTSVTRTGLSLAEGTVYYFTVRAYPNTGLPSSYAYSDGQLTDTIAPSATVQVTSALPAKAGPLDVKVILFDANGVSGTPALSYALPGGAARSIPLSFLSGSTWTGSGYLESWFSTGTVTFALSASDPAGNTGTAILSGSTFYMDTSVSGVTGGTVVNSDSTTVILPPGAAAAALVVITSTVPASRTSSADGGDTLAPAGYDLVREFKAQDLSSGHAVQAFSVPVTIKMYYPDADNNGIVDGTNVSESLIGIYWLDEVSNKWTPVYDGLVRDYAANSVQADVSHFSVYSLRYLDAAHIGTGKVKAYPNPCYLKDNPVTIAGIPPAARDVRIYIYDQAGNLVRTLESGSGVNSSNVGTWDGRNSSGRRAASGVYIYVVKTADMGKGSGKLAVIW